VSGPHVATNHGNKKVVNTICFAPFLQIDEVVFHLSGPHVTTNHGNKKVVNTICFAPFLQIDEVVFHLCCPSVIIVDWS
jgi:enhancing lycopene biosynthesis protein 2